MKTRTRNLPIVLEDEIDQSQEEAIQLAVAEAETRKRIFQALRDQGLPIPDDLQTDFGPVVAQAQTPAAPPQVTPQLGMNPQEISTPNLAPTMQDMQVDPADASSVLVPMPMPMPGAGMEEGDDVPEESNEQREGMPSAAKLYKRAGLMRELATPTPELQADEDGNLQPGHEPTGKWAAPGHLGKRRELVIDKDVPMDDPYAE
jgi:hypothetical protein